MFNNLVVNEPLCQMMSNPENVKKISYSKTCVKRSLSKRPKMVSKTNYCLMQVKSIAECSKGEHSAILLAFIKLPFVIKSFILPIFECPFYTGFTVHS